MPKKYINLTEHHARFVDELVVSGRYENASEVLGAGLRLLEQSIEREQRKLSMLRNLADDGFQQIDQGRGIELSSERQLSEYVAKLGREAIKPTPRQKPG